MNTYKLKYKNKIVSKCIIALTPNDSLTFWGVTYVILMLHGNATLFRGLTCLNYNLGIVVSKIIAAKIPPVGEGCLQPSQGLFDKVNQCIKFLAK